MSRHQCCEQNNFFKVYRCWNDCAGNTLEISELFFSYSLFHLKINVSWKCFESSVKYLLGSFRVSILHQADGATGRVSR